MTGAPSTTPARARAPKGSPQRTCVGCRRVDDRHGLVRFVAGDTEPYLAPDLRGRLPGRGYWVGARRACLAAAVERSAFRDALPSGATVDTGEIAKLTTLAFHRRVVGLVQGGWRNGLVALGVNEVTAAVHAQRSHGLWIATGGGTTRDKVRALADRFGLPCVEQLTEETLGDIFGRDRVAAVAFLDSALAVEARECLERATAFSEDA